MERIEGEAQYIDAKLQSWKRYLLSYDLPAWDDIPDIGLYMDQAVSLLGEYFDYLAPDIKGAPLVTKAMVNNYVQAGIVPLSVKKRYYRVHLVYLIIVCLLKQSLSIPQISVALPIDMPEDQLHRIYDRFVELRRISAVYFCDEVKKAIAPLQGKGRVDGAQLAIDNADDLVLASAITSGYGLLLTERLASSMNELYERGSVPE